MTSVAWTSFRMILVLCGMFLFLHEGTCLNPTGEDPITADFEKMWDLYNRHVHPDRKFERHRMNGMTVKQALYTLGYLDSAGKDTGYITIKKPTEANSPIIHYAQLNIDGIDVTTGMVARIKKAHLPTAKRGQIPKETKVNTQNTGAYKDHNGHLLAHSLGGNDETYNVLPQSQKTNTAGPWRRVEKQLLRFLKDPKTGSNDYIDWRLYVDLENPIHKDGKDSSITKATRPAGFFLSAVGYRFNNKDPEVFAKDFYVSNAKDGGVEYLKTHPEGDSEDESEFIALSELIYHGSTRKPPTR